VNGPYYKARDKGIKRALRLWRPQRTYLIIPDEFELEFK